VLGEVHEGSLAEAAGLEAGDVVLSVDGTEVADWDGVSQAMSAAREKGEDFEVVYERDGARRTALVDMPEGDKVELVGVSPQVEPYHLTLFEAMRGAVGYAGMVADVALRLIMPQHTMEVLDQSTSIVGISVMASQAVSAGVMDVIAIMAAVSMSLGFMNLLPIPPLDGGKMVMEVVELVLRRPLSMKARMAVSYVGIAFFVFVFVVVLRNDLLRYVIG
jgi:regulator of sigma E protease